MWGRRKRKDAELAPVVRRQLKEPVSSPNGVPLEVWRGWTVAQRYAYIEGDRGAVLDDTTTYSFRPIGAWPVGLVGPSFAVGRLGCERVVRAYAKRQGGTVTATGDMEWQLACGALVGRLAAHAL